MTAPDGIAQDAAALDCIQSGEVGVGPAVGKRLIAQARAALALSDEVASFRAALLREENATLSHPCGCSKERAK